MANETEGFVDRGGKGRMAVLFSQRSAHNQTDHNKRNRRDNTPGKNVYWECPEAMGGMQCG